MKEKNDITIKDVAALANVSVATAGRVIGNYGNVSEKTRQRVEEAARKLNYVPNALAQGMRKHSTLTIAVIVPNVRNNFFSGIIEAIEKVARKNKYNLLICNTHENRELEIQSIKTLITKQIDGILIATAFNEKKSIPEEEQNLYNEMVPMVLFDRQISGHYLNAVLTANCETAYNVTMYLIGLGHTRIATIGSAKNNTVSTTVVEREKGYQQALKEKKLEKNELSINVDWEDFEIVEREIGNLLDTKDITAIIILNNSLCGSVLYELRKRNMKFPEDISIVSWDDEEYCKLLDITVVDQPVERIGEYAANCLLDMIRGPEKRDGITITLPTKMIERKSCRRI